MIKKVAILFVMALISLFSCDIIQGVSDEERITKTTRTMLNYIADSNYRDFEKLLYKSNQRPLNVEGLIHYFNITHDCINKHISNTESLKIIFTGEPQIDNSIKIVIPVFKGFDSTNGLTSLNVILYYGPKEFVPLNKVTDFFIDDEYNTFYRETISKNDTVLFDGATKLDSATEAAIKKVNVFEDIIE